MNIEKEANELQIQLEKEWNNLPTKGEDRENLFNMLYGWMSNLHCTSTSEADIIAAKKFLTAVTTLQQDMFPVVSKELCGVAQETAEALKSIGIK